MATNTEQHGVIDRIIAVSIQKRSIVFVIAILIAAWGVYVASRMPVDVLPDLTAPVVTVVTEATGFTPEEVEAQISTPLETALSGLQGLRRIRSASGVAISVVYVEFDWDTDAYRARQMVTERVALANLRAQGAKPVLAPQSSVMGEVMFIGLRSSAHSTMELRSYADWVLRRRLLAIQGVAQVIPIGGDVRQFQVHLDEGKLAIYGVTLGEVAEALRAGAANAAGGFTIDGADQLLLQGIGRFRGISDVEQTLVRVRDGVPVLVGNLATVREAPAPKMGTASINGQTGVILPIQKQPAINTRELTERIDRELDTIEKTLPPGMSIERNLFRQSGFIDNAIRNVSHALRDGAILVVLIVFLFLYNFRAAITSLVALPLSLVVAALVLAALGQTLNVMTLGGITIAIGDLVDDAIIDVENVIRRLRLNAGKRPVAEVVFEASREVRGSIVFATAIIVIVFLPLLFLGGIEERLLAPLALSFIISLLASLVVALTVTPALCVRLFDEPRHLGHMHPSLERFIGAYERSLRPALRHPKLVVGIAFALFLSASVAVLLAGKGFIPTFNEGALTINAVTLPGLSVDESGKLAGRVEQALLSHPQVASIARRTGRAERDEHAQGPFASEMEVALKAAPRDREAFVAELRRLTQSIAGLQLTFGQPISHRIDHLLSGSKANVAIKLFGDDVSELGRLAGSVKAITESVPGLVDVSLETPPNIPTLTLQYDRIAMARLGVSVKDIAEAIEACGQGVVVGEVREGIRTYDVTVRMGIEPGPEALHHMVVKSATGAEVPLGRLVASTRDVGPHSIGHEDGNRRVVVIANVEGRDLVSAVDEVKAALAERLPLPQGYRIDIGGQYERASAARTRLLVSGLVVLAAMFGLLFLAFRRVGEALLVLLNLPLGLVGGAIGLYVSGGVLNVATTIGFITLFGISARNGIMLVAHVKHLREQESVTDWREAIERGARERLIPILMTALAAALALIPLAVRTGLPGSEIQGPMSIVILFGLLSSTALNLFVVPAVHVLAEERKERRTSIAQTRHLRSQGWPRP